MIWIVVRFEIESPDLSSCLCASDFLNISNVDIVCLQHESGIFGCLSGAYIPGLLPELRMRAVTAVHKVLRDPRAGPRRMRSFEKANCRGAALSALSRESPHLPSVVYACRAPCA